MKEVKVDYLDSNCVKKKPNPCQGRKNFDQWIIHLYNHTQMILFANDKVSSYLVPNIYSITTKTLFLFNIKNILKYQIEENKFDD